MKRTLAILILASPLTAQVVNPPIPAYISTLQLVSGTYTSGITATGTVGQTCTLTALNGGGSGATATVALTGTNTIAGGTALVVTAIGSGYTSAPTSSTAGSGTATCSGTAVIATVVGATVTSASTYITCPVACTVIPLDPSQGRQVCVDNAPGSTAVITLAALGASKFYSLTDNTAYGTANHTVVSGGALTDAICIVGLDATHYKVKSSTGTWSD